MVDVGVGDPDCRVHRPRCLMGVLHGRQPGSQVEELADSVPGCTLSAARAEDVPAIAELAAETDSFYGATESDPVSVRREQIDATLFADPPTARALLAWDGDTLAGFASYLFLWPAAGLTGSLYLKELYVTIAAQRTGVGAMLMRDLCAIAVKLGCSRVEWTTDPENKAAQAFYDVLACL
jgi:ribosomal protein S18 acetylase RimI-like enzyme